MSPDQPLQSSPPDFSFLQEQFDKLKTNTPATDSTTVAKLNELLSSPEKLASVRQQINSNPAAAREIVARTLSIDTHAHNRNATIQKRLDTWAYYKPAFGEQAKKWLDEMMKDGVDRKFKADPSKGKTVKTIYNCVYHGITYLIDHLDTDGKYREFKRTFEIAQTQTHVILKIIKVSAFTLEPERMLNYSTLDDIRIELDNFIDNAPFRSMLKLPNDNFLAFNLTQDEIKVIEDKLKRFDNFLTYIIGSSEIKVLKREVNPQAP